MKGANELNLNEATIIEALQEYFDARYKKPIKVNGVKQKNDGYASVFVVNVSEPEAPDAPRS